jgi:hypothetical protein
MMKVQIPTEAGNKAIQDGSLAQIVGGAVRGLKDEADNFIAEDGMRTGLIVFDLADSGDIPPAAEPFFISSAADITIVPAMNMDDARAGVEQAMKAM